MTGCSILRFDDRVDEHADERDDTSASHRFHRVFSIAPTPWKPRRASFFPCAVRYRNMNR
jgi:hypothetical protein